MTKALGFRLSGRPVSPVRYYCMNGWNNFDKTDREYSLCFTDDLVRFRGQRSKVGVTM